MYEEHWGLRQSPFQGKLDPASFYRSPTHDEALARLNFLVEQRRRLGLLAGPSGSGKSLLLEVFAQELRRRGNPVARLSLLDVEPTEMLWLLASAWGLNVEPSQSAAFLWRVLTDRLVEYRYQRIGAVLLFDDVDQADAAVLRHVARLVRFDPSPEMRLTIVLASRDARLSHGNESLLDLVELRIALEPWVREETAEFLASQLSGAGRQSPVFAPQAVDRLQQLSRGIPRSISQLADLALVAGAGQNLAQIDAGVVEAVYQELTA